MDIRSTITKKGNSKYVKRGGSFTQGDWKQAKEGSKGGIGQQSDIHESAVCMHMYHCICVLASNEYCVWVINKPCVRERDT
jgi:hypothetical protein